MDRQHDPTPAEHQGSTSTHQRLVLPRQISALFSVPVPRDRTAGKAASTSIEIFNSNKLANGSITRTLINRKYSQLYKYLSLVQESAKFQQGSFSNGYPKTCERSSDVFLDYFGCTGTMFYIFSPTEADSLFESVYVSTQPITKASLGALCAIAAVGAQYSTDDIDEQLRQSFYESAKFYVDECIEHDEVLGMQVLCLLTIYCIMDKRLTAWTWVSKWLRNISHLNDRHDCILTIVDSVWHETCNATRHTYGHQTALGSA
jgi:hypothetical protein